MINKRQDFPIWTQAIKLEGWQTQVVESKALRYTVPLCQGWDTIPQVSQTPLEVEHIYRGRYLSEWFTITFIENADPTADLRNLVEVILAATGFPLVSILPVNIQPKLLEWQPEGNCTALSHRLGVHETYLYQGLALLPIKPIELSRFYILLVRRGMLVWKISLSFISACSPGTSEDIAIANDHVRAGATFGYLHLL
ncbi:hypothetical protein [Coleofasciculus sp. FACHB-SPT9]|uniref:hypothetical protein n=1 Tax=Cyanophyceae TaxID=3028117 RepID=UPI001685327A|nr:hypothetical protein [Coleofasciculus sp. FACHB-SPT9]MBD1890545.1 hypothetical protein [Coleofasciculus sp. FACHB-SPT9]